MTYSSLRFFPSIFRKSRPVHLTFFVTRRCNARCPFCFYLSKRTGNSDGPELSLDEIRQLSSSMGNLLWLAFSGGEVFLRDNIFEISRVFYENNRPSIMLYSTNGMMPEIIRDKMEQILKYCKNSVITVKLSLDGIGEKHDIMRGVTGSFDKVIDTYEALKPLLFRFKNFELGINTVFCSANQNDMETIIEFVAGRDMIKTHTISMVRGDITDSSYRDVDVGKYLQGAKKLEEKLKKGKASRYGFRGAKIKAAQDILQSRLVFLTLAEQRRLLPCYAGSLNLVVTETGDVFPCESFSSHHYLGNLRDFHYDAGEILANERARRIISSIKKTCFCTHECYLMTNILFNPTFFPSLLKEYSQI